MSAWTDAQEARRRADLDARLRSTAMLAASRSHAGHQADVVVRVYRVYLEALREES